MCVRGERVIGGCGFLRRAVLCVETCGQVGSELVLFFLDPLCLAVHNDDHGFDWSLHDWGTVTIPFCQGLLLHYCG